MANITRAVCLGGDVVSEHDCINWSQSGTATVDIRVHGMVLLIDMHNMDTRMLSPMNIYNTDHLEDGQVLPYDNIKFKGKELRHAVKINEKWRELQFTGGYW